MLDNTLILWIATGIAVLTLLYLWSAYNSFVTERNRVKTDYADIDVQLKRRASLIENLATLVREYTKHEKGTFEDVTKARSAIENAKSAKESAKADNMLTSTLRSLFAVSEAYPELLASKNYQQLSETLQQTENSIAQYRETYNQTVLNYNNMLQVFPNLLVARLFGFTEEELFAPESGGTAEINLAA